jgi:histidine triad (HIT) family protein
MSESTIFKKIIDGEIPADIVYRDERCMAFRDVNPQAPTHVLVIPIKEIPSLAELDNSDHDLIGHMMLVTRQLAADLGLTNGFRTVVNTGSEGGQTVNHLHIHLLGGRDLSWPPG